MDKFITRKGDTFEWKQSKANTRTFELRRGTDAFGSLAFRSRLGTLAVSHDPVQDWTFKWEGFLKQKVTVRMPNADSDYAVFIPKFLSGGKLHLPDGRQLSWQPINFWHTHLQFCDTRNSPLLSFRQNYKSEGKYPLSEFFKMQAAVQVESSHITNLEFSLLVNLGFYLLVMQAMNSAAASAV